MKILRETGRLAAAVFDISKSKVGHRLFYHAHCQQKTIGAAEPTVQLLTDIGFDVVTSQVECCGMAGSFGYKKDFYDLSLAVGADLFGQVVQQDRDGGARQLIASGTSCTEQLHAGFERKILHPMELLETLIERQKESDKVGQRCRRRRSRGRSRSAQAIQEGSVQQLNRVYDRDVVSRSRE